jgi:hypothetical protein
MMLSLGKKFASGNQAVNATIQDDEAHIVDIDRTLEIDIPSLDRQSAEM